MLVLSRDLVGDYDGLLTPSVRLAEVIQALEEVTEDNRAWRARVGVASVQATNVHTAEDVPNACVKTCLEGRGVDAGSLSVHPSQGAPIAFPAHELDDAR